MAASVSSAFRLDGRRALVTGASRGIGRAIALGLATQGAEVLLHYHQDSDAAGNALREIKAGGGAGAIVQADLIQPAGADALAKQALAGGKLDILVLNASIQERKHLTEVDHALFQRHVDANLWSALRLIQATLPAMAERRWGRIVGIGSVQQVRPNPNLLAYAGLKSALSTMLRSLAREYAAQGVTCNVLAPGLIDTDRNDELKQNDALYRSILARIPAGQAGTAEDCVGAALLLCSDAGRYITGVDLLVDGGMHLP
ncbi:MAG TPA: SDR family oxidoreductase [Bauldia sp.]|nr:SDR family oxidoreductase [Bauldia sp.]